MKLDQFLKSYIVKTNSSLNAKMNDLHYTLSNEIMHLEVQLSLTQKEASNVCHISLNKLLKMENVDLDIPISTYLNSILILNQLYVITKCK